MADNIATKFSSILQTYHDMPVEFADAAGLALSSACFGPFFESKWVPKGMCNLYIVLSSVPGGARRSTAQNAFEYIVKKVYKHDIEQIEREREAEEEKEEKLTEYKFNQNVKKIKESFFIESGSEEGIADRLQEIYELGYDKLWVIFNSREFGSVLKKMFDRFSWEKGIAVILSKMFYGEGGNICLSTRGGKSGTRYIPEGMYAVVFAGMQEMKLYMSPDAVRQGTGRRILIVYHKLTKEDIDRHKPYIGLDRVYFSDELDKLVEEIIQRREYLKKCLKHNRQIAETKHWKENPETIDVLLDGNVEAEINKMDEDRFKKLVNYTTDENIVRQSDHEHLLRLAICAEIAKTQDLLVFEPKAGNYIAFVQKDSYEIAKRFLDMAVSSTKGEYDNLEDEDYKPKNLRRPEDKLYQKIVESMPEGITRTELMQKLGWHKDVLGDMLVRLFEQNKIIETEVQTITKSKTVYRTKPITDEEK